jgi:hypothetical protein
VLWKNIGIKELSVLVISQTLTEPEDFTREPTVLGFRVYLIQLENIVSYISELGLLVFENRGYGI